jgi:archaeosine-15-forming tRNA-guanine transglycosylase
MAKKKTSKKKGAKKSAKKSSSKKGASKKMSTKKMSTKKKGAKKSTKKGRRTTMYSSGGKKLYAVRAADGSFKDIQQYSRAHAQDIKRSSAAEEQAEMGMGQN